MTKNSSTTSPHCRDALLDAAEGLFAHEGFREVTTREIAEAAGVNLGLIQYYFGSKSGLFLAVVERLVKRNPCLSAGLIIEECPECPVVGSKRLCEFIYAYLEYLLRSTAPPCRVLAREVASPCDPELHDRLVNVVTDELTKPLQSSLSTIVRAITGSCKEDRAERTACSILGQCAFYSAQRPFIERLWEKSLGASPLFEEIGAHIATFSLRALGVEDEVIRTAVSEVFGAEFSDSPTTAPHERRPEKSGGTYGE